MPTQKPVIEQLAEIGDKLSVLKRRVKVSDGDIADLVALERFVRDQALVIEDAVDAWHDDNMVAFVKALNAD